MVNHLTRLTGPLSPEVSCLRYLEVLMLHENNLSWVIPLTLGACTNLVKLDVSKNNFRGDLPAKVGCCSKAKLNGPLFTFLVPARANYPNSLELGLWDTYKVGVLQPLK